MPKPNKSRLCKSLAIASLSLMTVMAPLHQLAPVAQAKPIREEITPAEKASSPVLRLVQAGLQKYKQQQHDAALIDFQQALQLARQQSLQPAAAMILIRISVVYAALGQKEKAFEFYRQALPLLSAEKNPSLQAIALNNIGVMYGNLGQYQQAIEYFNQALPFCREIKNRPMEAIVLFNLGSSYVTLKQTEPALVALNQALPILRDVKDRPNEGIALLLLGEIYNGLGQSEKAMSSFTLALDIMRDTKNAEGEKTALQNLGIGYTRLALNYASKNQPQQALDAYAQALKFWQAANDSKFEAIIYQRMGQVYADLGQPQEAMATHQKALTIWRAIKDRAGEATALLNLGYVYNQIGQPQKALDYYTQALQIRRELKDRQEEAITLNNMGAVYDNMGQFTKALDYYTQSLAIRRETNNKPGQGNNLNNIGLIYNKLGKLEQALDYYTQAIAISQEVKNRFLEAAAINNRAGIYTQIGQLDKALESFQQVLAIYREQKNRSAEATVLNNLGTVSLRMGQYPEALSYLNQALPILREVNNRSVEADTFNNLGAVANRLGQPEQALDYYVRALAMTREVKDRAGEAIGLSNIGFIYERIGQPAKALGYYTQSLSIAREVKDRTAEINTLGNLARLSQGQGDLNTALQQIEEAITLIETTRGEIRNTELRDTYFASVQDAYKLQIDLLMQLHKRNPSQGYDQQALQASERARARGLNDLLSEARVDIREGVDPAFLSQERELLGRLRDLETQRAKLLGKSDSANQLQQLEQDYAMLQQQYQQNQGQIRATSPRYAALTQPQPLSLKNIQALLDDNTLLLQYSLGGDHSYLWLVSRNGLQSYELPKSAEIDTLVRQYLRLLTDKNALKFQQQELEQVGAKLSQILLAPIASEVGQKRLVVVADGVLQYLPFAALPIPLTQKPLLTRHEIVNLPSATTLGLLRQDEKQRTQAPKMIAVLADPVFGKNDPRLTPGTLVASQFANPIVTPSLSQLFLTRSAANVGINFARLPSTATEANNILQSLPANQRFAGIGFAANLENATSPQLADYRIIHFATHGLMNSTDPALSGLVFSLFNAKGEPQNGFMRLQEIFNLKLKADLVVLSACQTGLGKEVQGEGLVGMTRGFMYAGSPRVLVSLWNVNDQGTSVLMSQFYQQMLGKGLPPAAALRQAQLAMLQQPQYQSPYYWAAFTLQGEWK